MQVNPLALRVRLSFAYGNPSAIPITSEYRTL